MFILSSKASLTIQGSRAIEAANTLGIPTESTAMESNNTNNKTWDHRGVKFGGDGNSQ